VHIVFIIEKSTEAEDFMEIVSKCLINFLKQNREKNVEKGEAKKMLNGSSFCPPDMLFYRRILAHFMNEKIFMIKEAR